MEQNDTYIKTTRSKPRDNKAKPEKREKEKRWTRRTDKREWLN